MTLTRPVAVERRLEWVRENGGEKLEIVRRSFVLLRFFVKRKKLGKQLERNGVKRVSVFVFCLFFKDERH